jgi:predicted PurR-regulated permease PerM
MINKIRRILLFIFAISVVGGGLSIALALAEFHLAAPFAGVFVLAMVLSWLLDLILSWFQRPQRRQHGFEVIVRPTQND